MFFFLYKHEWDRKIKEIFLKAYITQTKRPELFVFILKTWQNNKSIEPSKTKNLTNEKRTTGNRQLNTKKNKKLQSYFTEGKKLINQSH